MAELGNINVTQTNSGVSPISRGGDLAALNSGLNLTGKIITEAATADVRGDLAEDLNEEVQASGQSTYTPVTEADLEAAGLADDVSEHTDSQAIINFRNEMGNAQAQLSQAGAGGERTRAELRMLRTVQEAKAKYGWMRDEIQSEANKFMASSPELAEMGLRDAAATATGKSSPDTDYLEDIKKRAYGTGPNQLAIDPDVKFDSLEFAVQYKNKMALQQRTIALVEDEKYAKAIATRDIRPLIETATAMLNAPEGEIQQRYNLINARISEMEKIRRDFHAGAVTRGQMSDQERVWTEQVSSMSREIDNTIAQARIKFNNQFAKFVGDPRVEGLRGVFNARMEDLNVLKATLEDQPREVKLLLDTAARISVANATPEGGVLQGLMDIITTYPENGFDIVNKYTGSGSNKYDLHLMSQGLSAELEQTMGNLIAGGVENSGAASPDELRIRQEEAARTGRNSRLTAVYLEGKTPEERSQLLTTDALGQMQTVTDIAAPRFADELSQRQSADYLNNHATNLITLQNETNRTGLADVHRREVRAMLASPSTRRLIEEAGADDPAVRAFGAAVAKNYFAPGGVDELGAWTEDVLDIWEAPITEIGGVSFTAENTFVLNIDKLVSDGIVKLTVSPSYADAVIASAPAEMGVATTAMNASYGLGLIGGTSRDQYIQYATEAAEAKAAQLSREATQYVQSTGNMEYSLTGELDYQAAFNKQRHNPNARRDEPSLLSLARVFAPVAGENN